MNNIFSPSRFAKVVKSEILNNYRKYLTLLAALGVPFVFSIIFSFFSKSYNPSMFFYGGYISMLCAISPFLLYGNIFHKIKGVPYTMLPASNTEKFVSMLLQSFILVPLLLFIVLFLFLMIMTSIYNSPMPDMLNFLFNGQFIINMEGVPGGFFNSVYWSMLSFQAIAIWGVCFFRNHKIRNTILSYLGLGTAFIIIFFSLVSISGPNAHWLRAFLEWVEQSNLFIIMSIIFPFILWGWGYFKYTRQQF